MIEAAAQYLEVWRREGDKFALQGVFGVGDTFVSAALGAVTVEVAAIFGGRS